MTEPDTWTLVLDGWDPADEGRREALCTLGNGYLGTRGALPESRADGVHYPGTYAAGVFNRLADVVDGVAVENESMVNLPNWLDLRIAVEDGAWLDLAGVRVLEHREQLDTARGVLHRTTRVVDDAGRHSRLHQRRFVHRERRHLAGLHTSFTAEDWSGRLIVSSGVDGTVTNSGVSRYRHLSGRHLEVLATEETADDTVLLTAATTQSRHRIAVGARTRVTVPVDAPVTRAPDLVPGRIGHRLTVEVRAGETVEIEKIAAVVTSRDVAVAEPALAATALLAEAPGFEALLAEHSRSWERLWRRCRIELVDGEHPASATTVRDLRRCCWVSPWRSRWCARGRRRTPAGPSDRRADTSRQGWSSSLRRVDLVRRPPAISCPAAGGSPTRTCGSGGNVSGCSCSASRPPAPVGTATSRTRCGGAAARSRCLRSSSCRCSPWPADCAT